MSAKTPRPKKIKYKVGDVFLIPSSREGFNLGQVALDTTMEIGAPFCFFYEKDFLTLEPEDYENLDLKISDIVSAALITAELIKYQQWRICGNRPVPTHEALKQIETLRERRYVGAVITGGGLVADYLDTFYGVKSTTDWPDPNYVYSFFLNPPILHTTH